jgi:hypothetical protein
VPQSGSVDPRSGATGAIDRSAEQPLEETESPIVKRVVKRESTLQRKAREKIEARKAAKEAAARRVRAKKLSE